MKVDPVTGVVQRGSGPAGRGGRVPHRRAHQGGASTPTTGTLGSGFEGLDIQRQARQAVTWCSRAQQRGWNFTTSPACDAIDDDPGDMNATLRAEVDPHLGLRPAGTGGTAWSYIAVPTGTEAGQRGLDRAVGDQKWVDDGWILIERDNLTGDFGVFKKLTKLPLTPGADGAFTSGEKAFYDLRPRLTATRGWITDKPEGVGGAPQRPTVRRHRQRRRRRLVGGDVVFRPRPLLEPVPVGRLRITGSRGAPRSGPRITPAARRTRGTACR